jgi:hypothetical protein
MESQNPAHDQGSRDTLFVVDQPPRKLDYRRPGEERQPLGTVRRALCILGLLWFALCVTGAVMAFLMRDLGDEPGAPMTVASALVGSAVFVALGLPGIAVAVAAFRLGR